MSANVATNTNCFIIPDIPPAYMLDTDPIDSVYISQRYLLEALFEFSNGIVGTRLAIYDSPELQELIAWYEGIGLIDEHSIRRIESNLLLVPTHQYTPSEYIVGRKYDWGGYIASSGETLRSVQNGVPFQVKRLLVGMRRAPRGNMHIRGYKVTQAIRELRSWIVDNCPQLSVAIQWESDVDLAMTLQWKWFLHDNSLFLPAEKAEFHIPEGVFLKKTDDVDHIRDVVQSLVDMGVSRLACKPVYAASGEGIILLDTDEKIERFIETYQFPFWDIVLERLLDLSPLSSVLSELWNDPLSYSVQFQEWRLLGNPTIQLTHDGEFQGNIRFSETSYENLGLDNLTKRIADTSKRLIERIGIRWNGGFDFLIGTDQTPYFIDPNIGRDTWAFPLRTFEKLFPNVHSKDVMFVKVPAHGICGLERFQKLLAEKGVPLFSKDTNGVMPVTFVSGHHLSVIIVADTPHQLMRTFTDLKVLLSEQSEKRGRPDRPIMTTTGITNYSALHN